MELNKISGSFRDPSGFVFSHNETIYRAVTEIYRPHYDHLMGSGLYEKLALERLLIPHEEVSPPSGEAAGYYRILRPVPVPFISYPYEWCFPQLRDAALAVLRIQSIALDHGMTLKDATSFNVQFVRGSPCLIDTLSFEVYREGKPWSAYRQFVEHFLVPLALASMQTPAWIQFLRVHPSGIPVGTAHAILPFRTWLKFGLLVHIHLQALAIGLTRRGVLKDGASRRSFGKSSFYGLIDSLERAVKSLKPPRPSTGWSRYYRTGAGPEYVEAKKQLTIQFLNAAGAGTIWDIGANDGSISRLAAGSGARVVSLDSDHACVADNYCSVRAAGLENVLPLWVDITNPTPSVGWNGTERFSLLDRSPADAVLALALVHHLAIGNNVPLDRIAVFFRRICKFLIIEFVPKTDIHVKELLSTREDIFPGYNQESFERAFDRHFSTLQSAEVARSGRTMYLLKIRE